MLSHAHVHRYVGKIDMSIDVDVDIDRLVVLSVQTSLEADETQGQLSNHIVAGGL